MHFHRKIILSVVAFGFIGLSSCVNSVSANGGDQYIFGRGHVINDPSAWNLPRNFGKGALIGGAVGFVSPIVIAVTLLGLHEKDGILVYVIISTCSAGIIPFTIITAIGFGIINTFYKHLRPTMPREAGSIPKSKNEERILKIINDFLSPVQLYPNNMDVWECYPNVFSRPLNLENQDVKAANSFFNICKVIKDLYQKNSDKDKFLVAHFFYDSKIRKLGPITEIYNNLLDNEQITQEPNVGQAFDILEKVSVEFLQNLGDATDLTCDLQQGKLFLERSIPCINQALNNFQRLNQSNWKTVEISTAFQTVENAFTVQDLLKQDLLKIADR